ncbi:hypothetical protein [Planotetraspora sp. GP83]|uniref:hypothetical protein n=1 Tax=Planotetraspora sp. GP83 TaxID=3156264 RepID=UPI003515E686
MNAKMLGTARDILVCCAGHDPLILGSRRNRRRWVRINKRREQRAWRRDLDAGTRRGAH